MQMLSASALTEPMGWLGLTGLLRGDKVDHRAWAIGARVAYPLSGRR